jgi:2-polyprenyl-3-methyl-5-hydroxy-6-metoxy-1,4-benzoquinol methylase
MNLTQLDPDKNFERHVYHRDQFAHYLRWSHILKNIGRDNINILDWGCGSGNLLKTLYHNRRTCQEYLGLDYRQQTVKNANHEFLNVDWAFFKQADLTEANYKIEPENKLGWDIICSFEVAEHVGKDKIVEFLKNMYNNGSKNTVFYVSTPVYDPEVGAADNHTYPISTSNGVAVVNEFKYEEFKSLLENTGFKITANYGTFASQKDYKDSLSGWRLEAYRELSKYYDSNLVSNIMAPLVPAFQARNVLWVLSK